MTGAGTTTAVGAAAATAVAQWLRGVGVAATDPLRFEVIAGGRSNLTYQLTDAAGGRWVLRRPPLSTVLRSAHDVSREFRIMSALAGSGVPVPRMIGQCPDGAGLAAPFFVMDFVDGIVLSDQATAEQNLTESSRALAGDSIVDLLVRLHAVRPADVGLADLGRGGDYLGRQLRRWGEQLERIEAAEANQLRAMLSRLRIAAPEQSETTIVHGDFRPGNIIVAPHGPVRALLDWELCTLGDPRADLGWLLAYWGSDVGPAVPLSVPTRAAGFPSQADVLARYATATGRDVADIDYFVAFALWRLSVILAGVRDRVRRGAYGADADGAGDGRAVLDEKVAGTLAAADTALCRAGR